MAVETAVAGHVEHGLGQEQPVGDHHRDVAVEGGEGLAVGRVLEVQRRAHRQAEPFGLKLNRRGRQRQAAAAGLARRLGVDGGDVVAGRRQGGERRHREGRRSHEDDAQRHGPLRVAQAVLRAALVNFFTTMSRFSLEM